MRIKKILYSFIFTFIVGMGLFFMLSGNIKANIIDESRIGLYETTDDEVDQVIAKIDAIPETILYTPECKALIDSADSAYSALTREQKGLVPQAKLYKLQNSKNDYHYLESVYKEADVVIAKIDTIPNPVVYEEECKAIIEEARTLYDNLKESRKELVTNYEILTNAEEWYAELELSATRHSLEDTVSGVMVETSDGIGIPKNITLKADYEVSESYESYIKSNAEGNNIVGIYTVRLIQTIDGVEKEVQPSVIKERQKITIHLAIPEGIVPETSAILHIHNENDIKYVDNMRILGKEYVFEVSELSQFAILTPKPSLPVWIAASIIAGSVLAGFLIIYLLLFFVFNKWIVKNGKVKRVIKLGKKKVMRMYFKIETNPLIYGNKYEALAKSNPKDLESEIKKDIIFDDDDDDDFIEIKDE